MPAIDDQKFKVNLMYSKMQRIHTVATDLEKSPTDKKQQNLLRAASANLDDQFDEFHEAVTKLASLYSKQTPLVDEDLEKKFAEFEKLYYNVKAIVMTSLPEPAKVPRMSAASISGDGQGHNHVGLSTPKLQLAVFDGNILEWQSFHDLFSNTVHSADMSDVQKFVYLKSALRGEALGVIASLPTTAANYKVAWDSLVARYHDTNRLTNAYLEALFDIPTVSRDACSLRQFSSSIEQYMGALRALGHPTDGWHIPLMFVFKRKLVQQLREKWEKHAIELVLPAELKDFIRFLDNEVHVLEASKDIHSSVKSPSKSSKAKSSHGPSSFVTSGETVTTVCPCEKGHPLDRCPKFVKMPVGVRLKFVKSKHLCIACFSNHYLRDCSLKNEINCDRCGSPHHDLLCFKKYNSENPKPNRNPEIVPANSSSPGTTEPNSSSSSGSSNGPGEGRVQAYPVSAKTTTSTVMLATVSAIAVDRNGVDQIVKILIDSANQGTFVTSSCVERLGLRFDSYRTPIFGFGKSRAGVSKGLVEIMIKPRHSSVNFKVHALVVEQIARCPKLSSRSITWPHISGLSLADPQFYLDQPIDILLGAEWYARIVSGAPVLGPEGAPDLLNTVFGYCLLGRVDCENESSSHVMCTTCDSRTDRLIRAFWEVEEAPKKICRSPEEQECEEFYVRTVKRSEDGRYVVRLPFQQNSNLGDSYALARKRFHSLENRLRKNPVLRERYNEFMRDCLSQGHMIEAPSPPGDKHYYVPHHCIYRNDDTFSRFRVVFDCSMKTTNGLSLNNVLLIGPKLQAYVFDVLSLFRLHDVCIVGDVRQMYRNIAISEEDFDFQRIFWRFSEDEPVVEYCLVTVVYGNSSAPFLALRTVERLVEDEGGNFPEASQALLGNRFVDDICKSVPTIAQAQNLKGELTELLDKGKFVLRKWMSNRLEILEDIPEEHRAMSTDLFSFRHPEGIDPGTAILGLAWNPVTDAFSFRIQPSENGKVTKRIIFSELSRLYDPLGFLSPVTLYGKWLMQHLWTQGLEWDDEPSDELVSRWVQYRNEIPLLSQFSIPRCVNLDSATNVQLHGFSDASERGYAAMVYLRIIDQNSLVSISLLKAKSKVSPLKRESLPRLELCGAVILADLLGYARKLLAGHCTINSITAWCDSMVVLQWVKSSPHKWKTYVANRASYIHDRVSPSSFRYVPSGKNPSDIASRGALPQQFLSDPYWVNGPDWLKEPPAHWPQIPENLGDYDEVNTESRIISLPTIVPPRPNDQWITRFSSYPKLRRTTAYWLRYIRYLRDPVNNPYSLEGLTTEELKEATIRLVYVVQQQAFSSEIKSLATGKPPPSKLRKLNPFIDASFVIRVGGRLNNSKTISDDRKHPLFLPKDHHLNGLVEAGVKTIKKHLNRIILEQRLTFEEFYTILVQVEAVVNSRPITPVSSDPNDLQALTPGHFLMQQPADVLPEPELQDLDLSQRWKFLQQLLNSFWARWHIEYLGTLQMRAKWTQTSKNLRPGDMVILKEPNLPPTRWRLARVVNVFPGTDGTVRVAEVKTSQGTYTRTVRKLCPLPIN